MDSKNPDGLQPVLKNLSDSEIRLNCLDLAVRSWQLTGARRPGANPLVLAVEYVAWIKDGTMPAAPKAAQPMLPNVDHGKPPGPDEMAGRTADDHPAADNLTPGNRLPADGSPASLRQAAAPKK